jgi:hypothetical protein
MAVENVQRYEALQDEGRSAARAATIESSPPPSSRSANSGSGGSAGRSGTVALPESAIGTGPRRQPDGGAR